MILILLLILVLIILYYSDIVYETFMTDNKTLNINLNMNNKSQTYNPNIISPIYGSWNNYYPFNYFYGARYPYINNLYYNNPYYTQFMIY